MKLGVILPTIGRVASPDALDAVAASAVSLGWSSVWATDHLLVPAGPEAEEYGRVLEATSALTWVAARHPSLRVGFSVIIPAMRDAPLLAKQLATIDVLTGGRLAVGVGSSEKHDLPEYENLGKADRFAVRGRYLDETIALWRHLWSGDTSVFEGEFHQLRDFTFDPLPVQGAGVPIWCGGRSDRILRRAAFLCDGYHAAQTGPDDIRGRLPRLDELAAEAGRPRVTISVRVRVRFDAGALPVYSLHGSSAAMADEVRAFADAGVDELVVVFKEDEAAALVAAMERFQREVFEPVAAVA
jgi:alkanesulfonate monooxygenase SsuD/methylene tetrahydromethanopterin reductase-like flavin-dependent oxidoreductase (luciferase family)